MTDSNLTDVVSEFLRARLAADENWARPVLADATAIGIHGFAERFLRESEAKRAIIGGLLAFARQRREFRDHIYLPENADYHSGHADGMEDSAAWALRQMAAVYRDHPDYDPAWASGYDAEWA